MNSYIVKCDTLALVPISKLETKVIEKYGSFKIKKNVMKILEESCEYYGCTYLGRKEATKNMIDIVNKIPIIIEESNNLIMFPIVSPRQTKCVWISLNQIKKYDSKNNKTELYFMCNKKMTLNISYYSFNNQYLHATKLDSTLRKRINNAKE